MLPAGTVTWPLLPNARATKSTVVDIDAAAPVVMAATAATIVVTTKSKRFIDPPLKRAGLRRPTGDP